MNETKAALQVILADTFVFYFKVHTYHWNVEGANFGEMHEFFGGIYEDLYGTVDMWAEELRALGEYAPISLMELYNRKNIHEDAAKPNDVRAMLLNIKSANEIMIANLNVLFAVATKENIQNVANIAADRLDKHRKSGWMVDAYLKA